MNLKEYYKNLLSKIIFEQTDDIDTELNQELEAVYRLQTALDKERSQSSVSGRSALNDNMPIKGGPADYFQQHNSVEDKARAVRYGMSPTEKLTDPIGLKALGQATRLMQMQKTGNLSPMPTQSATERVYDNSINKKWERIGELKSEQMSGRRRNTNNPEPIRDPLPIDQNGQSLG